MQDSASAAFSEGGDRPVSAGIDSATADLIVAEVTAAVREYDDALVRNDLAALRGWFADSPETLRADAHGVLVGRDAIDRFRRASGGASRREVLRLHVVPLQVGAAVAVAETVRADGVRGLQTQAWVKRPEGWRISVAHVSTSPSATAAPGQQTEGRATADECDDRVLWRVRGHPLVRGAQGGELRGLTVAVKDLFAVAGHRIGAGNPTWLAESPTELTNASVVQSLLAMGANITGIVQTDEFAYSLGGTNVHYGTPRNPAAPGRTPGGSSSGPASAVALGLVDVGLGTDTAGSIRVPASYCGLYGFRPSHGVLAVQGLLPLAPSFDTVGWLAGDAVTFQRVAEGLLPPTDVVPLSRMLLADDVFALADPDVEVAVRRFARALAARLELRLEVVPSLCEGELDHWLVAFTLVQAAEAGQVHGQWLSTHPHALEPEIAERFARGKVITAQQRADAERVLMRAAGLLRDRLSPGTVLIQPATSTPAPPTASSGADKALLRAGTLGLTCLASIAGLPALVLPGPTVDALPVGVCLVGPRGSDANLAALASTATQTGV